MTTLCTTCIHFSDLDHDCAEYEQVTAQEATEKGNRNIVLECTGHAPIAIIEKTKPVAPLGTRKAVLS